MERADLLLEDAQLITVAGDEGPLAGPQQRELGLIEGGALAICDGRIIAAGRRQDVRDQVAATKATTLNGRVVLPGFVDAHTHPLWAGSRAAEFEMRVEGASYLEIMSAGGGIASTVRATREASDDTLRALLLKRLDSLVAHGTSTVEAKTGYGLSTAEELRQLELLREADRIHDINVVPTFLGAHALPDEYRDRQEDYVDLVVEEMIPAVAERNPGIFCDVFCDEGAFDRSQTERILHRAAEEGLRLKVHSDEFASLGCTGLAAELGAVSADHLGVTPLEEVLALAKWGAIAVLLPGTSFGLGHTEYADGRRFVDHGVPVALGTDLNPGTCPCESMVFMLALATRYLGLTPAEAIVAATRNAAYSCGRGEQAGRLQTGWPADLVVMDTTDYRDLAYRFGTNPVAGVMIGGKWVRHVDSAT